MYLTLTEPIFNNFPFYPGDGSDILTSDNFFWTFIGQVRFYFKFYAKFEYEWEKMKYSRGKNYLPDVGIEPTIFGFTLLISYSGYSNKTQ